MSNVEQLLIRLFEYKRGEDFSCVVMVKNMQYDCILDQSLPTDCPSDVAMAFFDEAEKAVNKQLEKDYEELTRPNSNKIS